MTLDDLVGTHTLSAIWRGYTKPEGGEISLSIRHPSWMRGQQPTTGDGL
jgi:hypothetical protein